MTAMRTGRPSWRLTRQEVVLLGVSAVTGLLLSPFIAVWALVICAPLAILTGALTIRNRRSLLWTVSLIASGIVLGVVPYFVLAAVRNT